MKKNSKLIFASAAMLAAFVSCQRVEEISEAPKTTHTVKFTTELPTKTSYVVDKDNNTVKYSWENADKDRLHVFDGEEEGTINSFNIDEETGVLRLEVSFNGSSEGSHTYTAYLNGAVKSEQIETSAGSYDPTCDVLVAKPVNEPDQNGAYTFQFRRPVAITELKLKDLTAGEKVSKVTVISDSEHPIAGKYTQSSTDDSTGDWSESSNKIVVSFGESKTVDGKGVLNLSIVTRPIKEASVKVLVETESGLKYRKVTASALTLLADVVKAQGIGLTPVSEAVHEEDGWYLVTDASELFDGDEIRIACTSENMMAGDFAVDNSKTQTYLANCAVSFNEGKLTGVTPGSEPQIFTLAEGYGKWNITTANGKLGATAAKSLKYNEGSLNWGISIGDEGVATISSETDGYGDIQYNASSPRFLNYTSGQTDIQIFKKYGTPEDPVIKIARTASFSTEKATVTIGAQGNVFPVLSFEPEEATGGEQTWTSSNTEVATVDNAGNVTLLTDGTTTIIVQITESETYQPCEASYELTVKPAEVQGMDIIDNDFVGNPGSYTSWKDKTSSSSGKTYAGNSTTKTNTNNIQMRATKPSGIVVTASDGGKVARKITVKWDTSTDRTIDVYGKDSAYSSEDGARDLYDNSTDGDKLGSIVYGTSTELEIEGDYEFIGLRSNSGALYVESITIQWEDPKPEYEACFKDVGGNTVKEVNATVGSVFTAPTLYKGATHGFADAYESSNPDVAEVSNTGVVTPHKKGDAIITATLNGDETHRKTEVSYTIHVANVLSSIEITTEPTKKSYYVGEEADHSGIAVTAHYNDDTFAEIATDKLNFSGFDSSAAVAEQAITVSYTENDVTKTATYNVEIVAATTLYDIDVTGAADANGNSVTVDGNKDKAEEGDGITLNVNLATGYKLTSLNVNGTEHKTDVTGGKYTFTMPAEAVAVTASFDNHYNVVLGSATNGSFTVSGESMSPVSIVYGTTVNLAATPATGYVFKKWTVEGATVASATAATTSFTMPANEVTVNAEFEQPQDKVYFYESFNSCAKEGGNDGKWSNITTSGDIIGNDGWVFANGNAASACARFGTSKALGSATTPELDINTTSAVLKFKAAAWGTDNTTLKLSIASGTAILEKSSVTMVSSEWSTFKVNLTGISGKIKIKFEGNSNSSSRFFLDEVYVYYGSEPIPTRTLESLEWTGYTASYEKDSDFSIDGTIKAVYDNGDKELLTKEDVTLTTSPNMSVVGSTSAVISYTSGSVTKTATATITITQAGQGGGDPLKTQLTSAQIKSGSGATSYGDCSATDGNGFTYLAYAIKNQHSNATSDYNFWQIKKYASKLAYFVQLPEFPGNIKTIKLTVSGSGQAMTAGGNAATLYFSSSNSTAADGTGVVSGTGASSITIDASSLNLNTGYITASGALRIWDIEIEYYPN